LSRYSEYSVYLDSARGWGLFDLFGGGGITGLIKHSKLNDASDYLEQVQQDLKIFKRELQDVEIPGTIRIDIDGFLTFADFFFDGFLADYMVQRKINDAREQVQEAIEQVETIMEKLRRCK
jgi:ribosomal protein L22